MRAIIADDEPLAREGLLRLLSSHKDVEVVAQCKNGLEVLETVPHFGPDVLFLDIQMPGLDGFAVLERLSAPKFPLVIFVTAYDQFAVKAFEQNALDYLLKPFSAERLAQTLRRARLQLQGSERVYYRRLDALTNSVQTIKEGPPRFLITDRHRTFFLDSSEIEVVRGSDYYSSILTTSGKTHLIRLPLQEIEQRLREHGFARVHRSSIVSLSSIREFRKSSHHLTLVMASGSEVSVSRTYRRALAQRFQKDV